jgi:hypothetical protein
MGSRKLLSASVEMVESSGDLASDLHVGLVIPGHRHQMGAGEQDVGSLQHRITQQPERDRP